MDMYMDQGEPSEKCGELNFGLEYDFATQTLKLKIIQVKYFFDIYRYLKKVEKTIKRMLICNTVYMLLPQHAINHGYSFGI